MVAEFTDINRAMEKTGTFEMERKKLFQLVGKANSNLADVILKLGLFERLFSCGFWFLIKMMHTFWMCSLFVWHICLLIECVAGWAFVDLTSIETAVEWVACSFNVLCFK